MESITHNEDNELEETTQEEKIKYIEKHYKKFPAQLDGIVPIDGNSNMVEVFRITYKNRKDILIYNKDDKKLYYKLIDNEIDTIPVLVSLLTELSKLNLYNDNGSLKQLIDYLYGDQQKLSKGGKKTTYRLNGEKVVLLHKNKKVQRSIYVKGKGKTKYCKIDKEYVLLSKIKNKIQ